MCSLLEDLRKIILSSLEPDIAVLKAIQDLHPALTL